MKLVGIIFLGLTAALAAFAGAAMFFVWTIGNGFASHTQWEKFPLVLFPLLYAIAAIVLAIKLGRNTSDGSSHQ